MFLLSQRLTCASMVLFHPVLGLPPVGQNIIAAILPTSGEKEQNLGRLSEVLTTKIAECDILLLTWQI